MGKHNEFGKLGEAIAVDFLVEAGYEICDKNYRYQKAEIDILAKKGDVLAVVEVKSRTLGFYKSLNDVIGQGKIQRLVLAADHYIQQHKLDCEVRFDVVTVVKTKGKFKTEHLKNAFYHF